MNQFAISLSERNKNFYYNFSQIGYDLKYFSINCSFQFSQVLVPHSDLYTDVGPQIVVPLQKFYLKPWYTIDPGHPTIRKFIMGVGYHF